jgi:hypothetical protein
MQRTASRTPLHTPQQVADASYWLKQPAQARIDALEALRRQHHAGANQDADFRLQRVCRITQLK